MTLPRYEISLSPDQEKIAQLLTRDAWGYFRSLISARELFHVKEIPLMPRRGRFSLPADEELIQYYIDYAGSYTEELALFGWSPARVEEASEGFVLCLEDISGQVRGRLAKAHCYSA